MPYGIIKVDQVTFTNAGVDQTISVSGIVASISGNITATGTISGDVIRGGTLVSGATVTGTAGQFGTITGNTAGFTTVTGTTITGTTLTVASGTFTGNSTAAAFIPTGSTVPTNGVYLPSANNVAISTNGTQRLTVDSGGVTSANGGVFKGDVTTYSVDGIALSFVSNVSQIRACRSGGNYGNLAFFTPGANSSGVQAERVRITSEGLVGVGTTSPARTLHVAGSAVFADTVDTTVWAQFSTGVGGIGTNNNYPFAFATNGTERARIDSSGRLGIGTSSPLKELQINATTPTIRLEENSAGAKRLELSVNSSAEASVFATQSASQLLFGTVGTERMRIDSSGRVGIGTTSVASILHTSGSSDQAVTIQTTTAGADTRINFRNSAGTDAGGIQYLHNGNHLLFNANSGERARIDGSGRLLVGTSSSPNAGQGQYGIVVAQGYAGSATGEGIVSIQRGIAATSITSGNDIGRLVFCDNAGNTFAGIYCNADANAGSGDYPGRLVFSTTADGASSPTERMRIGSSGKTTIKGATSDSSGYSLEVTESGGIVQFTIRNDGVILTGTDTLSPYNNTTASAANLFVTSGGELQRSTSSLKYKKNVQDAPYGLQELMALRAVTYQGKSTSDGDTVYGGLIAEEVDAAGLQEFVQYADDGTPDALAYGNMVSLCIKAIQEQQEIIAELQAKVAALETK